MIIILKDQYKSLRPFESEELNSLTIITGKNGSGKSQLLDLINKKTINDPSVVSIRLELTPTVSKIQTEGIIKENSTSIGHDQWKTIVKKQLDNFKTLTDTSRKIINYIIENKLQTTASNNSRQSLLSDELEYKELLAKLNAEQFSMPIIPTEQVNLQIERRNLRKIFNPKNEGLFRFIKELCEFTGKTEPELTDADFYNTPIQEHLIDANDLFSSQVELIFYNYAKRRDQNRKNHFYKKEDGEENNAVSDDEFVKTYIPPWQLINEILTKHNIDFYFKGIDKKEFTIEVPIDFKLYKKIN